MAPLRVTSREYKTMLDAARFQGDETAMLATAGTFWNAFAHQVRDLVRLQEGQALNEIAKRRLIRFHDARTTNAGPGAEYRLRSNGYVLRERTNLKGKKREVKLKYRHPDRYVAESRSMKPDNKDEVRTKFEEDVKSIDAAPPFLSLYSFAAKRRIGRQPLEAMRDPVKFFPSLKTWLDTYDKKEPLEPVGGFTAQELVITGGHVSLPPDVAVECALVVWYDQTADPQIQPKVVEFSFRYGDDEESYSGETALAAYRVFARLQEELTDSWVSRDTPTKTAFVYGLSHGIV